MPEHTPSLISTGLVVVSVIFPILSVLCIYLRFKARRISRQMFQADDWWIIATWILSLSLSINVFIYARKIGVDYFHEDALSGAVDSAVCLVVASLLTGIVLACVKISILLFYKRIFVTLKFRIAAWAAIVFVSCWGIAMFLIVLLQGDPAEFVINGKSEFRIDPVAVGFTQVGSSVALDILVLCFPLPVIYRLKMPTKKKLLVGLIFWLGIFCCVAAIVRLVLLGQVLTRVLDAPTQVSLQSTQFIFLILEPHCSMIAACLPCLGPLFAGGRAPESIIRSVRSMLSLASRNSSQQSSKAVGLPSHDESQAELRQSDLAWPQSQNSVHIAKADGDTIPTHYDEDIELQNRDRINVTKGVDVVRG
ncbi:hypothetical protein F4810DRAFT_662535 [Camillea tinctor]|nr:hypothetical protein F4810DRAFT_662535 [Camillea tinctor]